MPVLTAIGEVGIEAGGRSYILRPSLFSMTRIGSPKEIVEAAAVLLGDEPDAATHPVFGPWRRKQYLRDRFHWALCVLHACTEDDLSPLVGGFTPRGGRGMAYSPGAMATEDIVIIAKGLIRHGISGDQKATKSANSSDYMTEFHATEIACTAMAHLGASERDAWNMTMTSFLGAMKAKFPPQDAGGGAAPSVAQYDQTMAWYDKVQAAKRKKAANNG